MDDARKTGGRYGDRVGWNGEQRPHRDYSEKWLERIVRGLYQSVVDEPVPQTLLDLVERAHIDPSVPDALVRARRWRAKAEECRAMAASMHNASAREALLMLAASYDTLA